MDLMNLVFLLVGILIGVVIGFFVTKRIFTKQLEKNPPINEDMIKVMMQQMGRPASQKQINQIMKSMNQYKK